MSESSEAAAVSPRTIVADLGKRKRKQVKKLRRGEGKLTQEVQDLVAALRADGDAAEGDTIVVVVEKKQDRWSIKGW